MQNPIEVKFVTKLNRFERATTFIKERFSFEVHRKSYSRWKKWTFDLGLRKFSNMFDFPNFQLKIHHDTSFKWKSVEHESCSSWSNLSKKSKFIHFGQELYRLRMAWTLHHHLAKIKLQASMYNCLALQFDFRLVHTQLWIKWNDLMGLYMPTHTCITHCQYWKLNCKVQISCDSAINRSPYAQN